MTKETIDDKILLEHRIQKAYEIGNLQVKLTLKNLEVTRLQKAIEEASKTIDNLCSEKSSFIQQIEALQKINLPTKI